MYHWLIPKQNARSGTSRYPERTFLINTINRAKSSTILFSLVETAKINALRLYEYFKYLLKDILSHIRDSVDKFNVHLKNQLLCSKNFQWKYESSKPGCPKSNQAAYLGQGHALYRLPFILAYARNCPKCICSTMHTMFH